MKRYLFLKLGLTILICAAASPRTQTAENFASNRDVNKRSSNKQNSDQIEDSSSQQGDPKAKLEDYQGVMGKPGVDFPILTYIPRTAFTCRGKKSGYYADLETNCQVFHICEEGRKVSFLCPNGTIFQQSDLICDWWFKVDCATSPTLYDESAEQLYEENIRRKENRRVQEQERRAIKLRHQNDNNKSGQNLNQANYVKKDTNQYTSHQNNNRYDSFHHSREDFSNNYKETQIPSETASFVNNRYNSEQQKKYFKSINDVGGDAQAYTQTKTFVTNDFSSIKATTEKIVNRGSKTYNSFTSKIHYRNQVPDIIKTTTQHTIYSPTVPPFTTTRFTTRTPTTYVPTSTQTSKSNIVSTTRSNKLAGFYITKDLKSNSKFAPVASNVSTHQSVTENDTPFYKSKIVTSSPSPFVTTPMSWTTLATVDVTHPLVGSGLVTRIKDFTNDQSQTTTESSNLFQNLQDVSTIFPFEDITVKNTAIPSIPTPFRTREITESKFTYLPKTNNSQIPTPKPTLPTEYTTLNIAPTVTENLSNMIKTLEEIDKNPSIDLDKQLGARPGLHIPPSAGPKTLHSLAIYFATALDNLVSSNETIDNDEFTTLSAVDDSQVTLLSRTTQDKFNLLFDEHHTEHNVTDTPLNDKSDIDLRSLVEHDAQYNDLDSQQSRGLVSSTPRIRQLAQVFTQALSAYLDDPDTFKKVLEEIRPTEPPLLSESNTETTLESTLPTTLTTDYRSYTKEEDEVLDFSDADKSSTYRPFNDNIRTTESTIIVRSTTETFLNKISSNLPLETLKSNESINLIKRIPTPNPIALSLNNGLKLSNSSILQDIEDESSVEENTESDDYFPFNTGEDEEDAKIKATAKPYGVGVKPENSTPINIFPQIPPTSNSWNFADSFNQNASKPSDSLLPPFKISLLNKKDEINSSYVLNDEYLQSAHSQSFLSHSNNIHSERKGKTVNLNENTHSTTEFDRDTTIFTTTTVPNNYIYSTESTTSYDGETTTHFFPTRHLYDESTTTENPTSTTEPIETTHTTTHFPPEFSTIETTTSWPEPTTLSKAVPINHWSTSPEVTKLWESTLYVDPLIINRNLDESENSTYGDLNTPTTYRPDYSTIPFYKTTTDFIDDGIIDIKFTSTTEEPGETTSTTLETTTTSDIYTTVIDLGIHSLLNSTELEIASSQAHQIFGNLNSTEQDLLIEKMKEAESNSTVRRLILLLVSTCDASLSNNKTVQETRNSILHALLNVRSNKESDKSGEISNRSEKQLNLNEQSFEISTTILPETTSVTDRFSRKSSAIISNIEVPNKIVDVKDVQQDTRALELLRSLYSLAAKWGKK